MRTNRTRGRSTALWSLVFLGLAVVAAMLFSFPAEGADEDKQFMIAKGRVTFRVYCINCHGAKAKGDGSLAELLTVQPSDLTIVASANDGEFPKERIYDIVDGRSVGVRGHGMKEMPVWGDVFQTSSFEPSGSGGEEGEERAQRKIWEVVYYLESVQETGTAQGE